MADDTFYEETSYDEWNFKPVLTQHNVNNEELLLALNNHMDNWATTYTNKRDTAKKAIYNEILCCALQLSIKGGKHEEKDTLLDELITMLKEGIEEENCDGR